LPKLHNSIRVNALPDKVWQVLGDPLATPQWIPGLTEAKMEGNNRVCTTMDGQEIQEEVTYSAETKSFQYVQIKVPLPIRDSHGAMRLQQDADGCLVLWDAEFDVPDSTQETQVTQMIDGYYKQTLDSLRQRIESLR
jgi:uncharacterized protein YndB with AHSA1/START domain